GLFGVWDLEFGIYLAFGAWTLVLSLGAFPLFSTPAIFASLLTPGSTVAAHDIQYVRILHRIPCAGCHSLPPRSPRRATLGLSDFRSSLFCIFFPRSNRRRRWRVLSVDICLGKHF